MGKIILTALEGGNPLAYLAALGTLRVATLSWPKNNLCLSWEKIEGGWRPCVHNDENIDNNSFIEGLHGYLKSCINEPAFKISTDLNLSCSTFRDIAKVAQGKAKADDRNYADFIAAFGSESVESLKNGKRTGNIADTAFRTMSGAGHQHFVGFMLELCKVTEKENISDSLFKTWSYSDPGPSFRWDPIDDRRYALRWKQPSTDPVRTARGANRLAIEALPILPTAPFNGRLETTGFTQLKHQNVYWSWPIWTCALNMDVVRSLLALSELQQTNPDRKMLKVMGIEEVYRSERITEGKYRNFTPAVPA